MVDFQPSPTRLLYALRRAHQAVETRKEAALRELGLSPAHYAVLINVWAHPGTTGAELARTLGVSPQNTAALIARLLERGWLHRSPHERHRHVLEVRLTEHGQKVLMAADERVAALEGHLREQLSPEVGAALFEHLEALVRAAAAGDASGTKG